MKSKKTIFALLFVGLVTLFSASVSFAQDDMKKDDGMKKDGAMMKDDGMKKDDAMMKDDGMKKDAMMKDDRPIVAIIEADWCPYCKNLNPIIAELKKDYSEKLNFIAFDVTDEKRIAESKAKAESLGLSEFFEKFKEKTSAVVIMKDKKIVYKTYHNEKKADFVKAFADAAK